MTTQLSGETQRDIEGETGDAASGTRRGGPVWLTPFLGIVVAFLIFWGFVRPGPTWADWVVLGAIVLTVVGAMIALNPRRSSPPGGTRER